MKSGSFPFEGISGFDLVGEEAELVALRFTEICLIGFPKEKEEVENVILGEMEIDDPRTSAFSVTAESHSDFSKPMTTDEKITTFWISKEFLLEDAVVRVANTIGNLASEMRGFDEGERHRKVGYYVSYRSQLRI